jgi:hypothetical protein
MIWYWLGHAASFALGAAACFVFIVWFTNRAP